MNCQASAANSNVGRLLDTTTLSGWIATTDESRRFGLASVIWEEAFPGAEVGKAKSSSMSERRISKATGASSAVKYKLATVSTSHRLFKWTRLLRSSEGQRGTQPDAIVDARSAAETTPLSSA